MLFGLRTTTDEQHANVKAATGQAFSGAQQSLVIFDRHHATNGAEHDRLRSEAKAFPNLKASLGVGGEQPGIHSIADHPDTVRRYPTLSTMVAREVAAHGKERITELINFVAQQPPP